MDRQRLTTKFAKSVKAPDSGQAFFFDIEIPQFALRVLPSGGRSWIINLTHCGKLYRRTLAPLARCSADEARDKAKVAIGQIISGSGEYVLTREQKAAMREQSEHAAREVRRARQDAQHHTLQRLCELYVEDLKRRGRSSWRDVDNAFKRHVYDRPEAARPARELKLVDVGAILRPVVKVGKERTAGKLRSYLHAAYKLAASAPGKMRSDPELAALGVESNPVQFAEAISSKTRTRSLTEGELGIIFRSLSKDTRPTARVAWANVLLGGQRPTQLLRAKVENFDGAILTIFDGKGKRKEPRRHDVPVIGEAVGILQGFATAARERGSSWLFGNGRPMWTATMGGPVVEISDRLAAEAKKAGRPFEKFSLRDLRASVETQLVGMRVSKGVRAQLLSHGISGVQDVHYDKFDYTDMKREALVLWHARIAELIEGRKSASVTQIRSAA